jgi:hypothetical protein
MSAGAVDNKSLLVVDTGFLLDQVIFNLYFLGVLFSLMIVYVFPLSES